MMCIWILLAFAVGFVCKCIFEFVSVWIVNRKITNNKHIYIVKFIYSCNKDIVADGTWLFKKEWEQEAVVEALDIMDAGVEFAKTHVLSPNVCITRINKVK